MKFILLVLIASVSTAFAMERLNWVVATVNRNPITMYDIQRYNAFILENSGGLITNTKEEGLTSWMTYYIIKSLSERNRRYQLAPGEITTAMAPHIAMTNDNPQLALIFQRHGDLLQKRIEMNLYIQKLAFFNEGFKRNLHQGIDEAEARAFYEKNRSNFVSPPQLSLMVFAAPYPDAATLTERASFEQTFQTIAQEAARTTNARPIIERHRRTVAFTPYSGNSGFTNAQVLFHAGYPEEVLGLALDPNYYRQFLSRGRVFGPQMIRFRRDRRNYMLVMRVLERRETGFLPFEQVRNYIHNMLQSQRIERVIHEWSAEEIRSRRVSVQIKDKNYQGVLDAYVRR